MLCCYPPNSANFYLNPPEEPLGAFDGAFVGDDHRVGLFALLGYNVPFFGDFFEEIVDFGLLGLVHVDFGFGFQVQVDFIGEGLW